MSTTTNVTATVFACNFPECTCTMAPSEAMVPAIAGIRTRKESQGDRSRVKVSDLEKDVFCKKHALAIRHQSGNTVAFHPYTATVGKIERDEEGIRKHRADRAEKEKVATNIGALYSSARS